MKPNQIAQRQAGKVTQNVALCRMLNRTDSFIETSGRQRRSFFVGGGYDDGGESPPPPQEEEDREPSPPPSHQNGHHHHHHQHRRRETDDEWDSRVKGGKPKVFQPHRHHRYHGD